MEEYLCKASRFSLGVGIFIGVFGLYWIGPLSCILQKATFLSFFPAILVLTGIFRRLTEWQLGKKRLPVSDEAVLITGCDSGFGQILAKRLADKGYQVFAGCFMPDGAGATNLREYSSRMNVIPMDVTSSESVLAAKTAVQQKLQEKGLRLWAVVANAGIANQGPLEWTSMDEVKQVFEVNTFGVLRTVKAFLPFIRRSKGRVVVTSSMLATIANPLVIPYCMSKAAVKSLVEGLQRELGRFGIYCSSIEPNYYATNMLQLRTMADFEVKYSALDEEMKKDYEGFMSVCKRYFQSAFGVLTSTKLEEPLSAFEHAISSIRPRPFYTVDSPVLAVLRETLQHFNIECTDAVVYLFEYLAEIAKRTGLWKKRS